VLGARARELGIELAHPAPVRPDRPIAPDEVIAKFRDNASRLLSPDRVADLEQAVLDLERAADMRAIDALCRIA